MKYLEDAQLQALTAQLTDAAALGDSRRIYGKLELYSMKRAGLDKKYASALGQRFVQELEDCEQTLQQNVVLHRKRSQSADFAVHETLQHHAKRNRSSSFDSAAAAPSKQAPLQKAPRSVSQPVLPSHPVLPSPLGDWQSLGTRKLMINLILTLNASFPDYDFGQVRPDDFTKVSLAECTQHVNQSLSELPKAMTLLTRIWKAMDDQTPLQECDIYSLNIDNVADFLQPTLTETNDAASDADSTMLWSFLYFLVHRGLKRIVLFTCIGTIPNLTSPMELDDEEVVVQDDSERTVDVEAASSVHLSRYNSVATTEGAGDTDTVAETASIASSVPIRTV